MCAAQSKSRLRTKDVRVQLRRKRGVVKHKIAFLSFAMHTRRVKAGHAIGVASGCTTFVGLHAHDQLRSFHAAPQNPPCHVPPCRTFALRLGLLAAPGPAKPGPAPAGGRAGEMNFPCPIWPRF